MLLYPRQGLKFMIWRKDYILSRWSNFKGIAGRGAEYILINFITGCLAYLNRIWSTDWTVRKKFGYHSSLPCHDRHLCPWEINEFSCFTFYPLTVTRTWFRRHEFYTLVFHITLVLQINPHLIHHGLDYHQHTDQNLIFVVPCIMLNSEINPTRCNNCVYSSQWHNTTIILTKLQHKYTCLPEAIYSICTPDDGWNCHPKHVE